MEKAARFIRDLNFGDLEEGVVNKAKMCFLDFIGAVLAGQASESGRLSINFAKHNSRAYEATILATGDQVSLRDAAFVNGNLASALDIDDGHRMAVGHPGAVVIPAALAIAERYRMSGRKFIEAIVAGYEVAIRSGDILSKQTGIVWGSGRWACVGAAAAVAKLLDLGSKEIKNALAIAGTLTPLAPLLDDLSQGRMPMTRESTGWGAMTGLSSALLAKEGFTGLSSIVDFSLTSLGDFGEKFEILNVYFKPYACCRWCHPAIDGALELVQEHDLHPADIKEIVVSTFSHAANLAESRPRTIDMAQYSIPFTVATAVVEAEVGVDQIAKGKLSDPQVLDVASRVRLIHDAKLDSYFPERIPAKVEIQTVSGDRYQTRVDIPKGNPRNPMSEREFLDKFKKLATKVIGPQDAIKVIKKVKELEGCQDINEVINFFTKIQLRTM